MFVYDNPMKQKGIIEELPLLKMARDPIISLNIVTVWFSMGDPVYLKN